MIQYVCIHLFWYQYDNAQRWESKLYYYKFYSVPVVAFRFLNIDSQQLFNLEPLLIVTSIIMSNDIPDYGLTVIECAYSIPSI